MKSFRILLKNELKLNIRNMNMVIFAVIMPLVVLVNGNSASASEIFAGAIQDYGTGTIVGTTTFGKGIVQRIMKLSDGSAVKLTVSKYYTPKGNNIHEIGISPDVEVPFEAEAYLEEKNPGHVK